MHRIYSMLGQIGEIVWKVVDGDNGMELSQEFESHDAAIAWCQANGYSFELLVENADDDWDDESDEADPSGNHKMSEPQRIHRWSAEDLLNVEERILLIESRWIPLWAGSHTQTAKRFVGLVEAARSGRPWAEMFVTFDSSERDLVGCTVGLWAQALGVSDREASGLIDELHSDVWRSGHWAFNT